MTTINEQRFLILTALAGGSRHGYGLAEEIARLTDGAVRPRAGSLYHALGRMLAAGLVAVDREEIVDGRLRRSYCITGPGRDRLGMEARQRQDVAAKALSRLASPA